MPKQLSIRPTGIRRIATTYNTIPIIKYISHKQIITLKLTAIKIAENDVIAARNDGNDILQKKHS